MVKELAVLGISSVLLSTATELHRTKNQTPLPSRAAVETH
jgi:hypothetical protein